MSGSSEMLAKSVPVQRRWSDLGVRALSGICLVAIAIVTAREGGTLFVATWLIAAVVLLWEWQRLVDGPVWRWRVFTGALFVVAAAALARSGDVGEAILALVVAAAFLALMAGPGHRIWAATGLVYAGMLVVAMIALRLSFPFGSRAIIWLFMTVWATDVFAYFGGRLIGGPKIWPRVSPSKTWSGTLTGVGVGALFGTFVAVRDLPAPSAIAPIFLITLVAATLSQGGDAFESAMKRHFGVKDTSRLIPGHGGIMDRLDGFIAAAVFAFLVGLLRNLPSVAGGLFYWP